MTQYQKVIKQFNMSIIIFLIRYIHIVLIYLTLYITNCIALTSALTSKVERLLLDPAKYVSTFTLYSQWYTIDIKYLNFSDAVTYYVKMFKFVPITSFLSRLRSTLRLVIYFLQIIFIYIAQKCRSAVQDCKQSCVKNIKCVCQLQLFVNVNVKINLKFYG